MKRAVFFLLLGCLALTAPAAAADEAPLGVCQSLLQAMSDPPATSAETPLGDLCADAVRAMAETDLAVVSADEFAANLQPGEVFRRDVDAALPSGRDYVCARVTPAGLRALLEEALGHVALTERCAIDREASADGGFLQVSGFTLRYDPNFPAGDRVREIAVNGEPLELADDETLYTLAMPEALAGSGLFADEPVSAGFTAAQAVSAYILALGSVPLPADGRIHPIAVRENDLINRFPVVLIAFAGIAAAVSAKGLTRLRRENRGR